MKKFFLCLFLLFLSAAAVGKIQYEGNPFAGYRFYTVSRDLNSGFLHPDLGELLRADTESRAMYDAWVWQQIAGQLLFLSGAVSAMYGSYSWGAYDVFEKNGVIFFAAGMTGVLAGVVVGVLSWGNLENAVRRYNAQTVPELALTVGGGQAAEGLIRFRF